MKQIAGVDAKWWIVGGTAAAGVVYWVYKRNLSSGGAAPTTDPNIDSNTGLPYGFDTGSSSPVQGTTPSLYGYIDPTTGQFIGGSGTGSGVVTAPSTNGQWAQQAEAYLSTLGYDPLTVAVALGKYLSGQTLTDEQMGIVSAAIAFYGNPPTAVPPPHVTPPVGQGPNPPSLPAEHGTVRRKDSPANPFPIATKSAGTTWPEVVLGHYTGVPVDNKIRSNLGYQLAHLNGKGGTTNPRGLSIILPSQMSY